jgi:hypothetical protein
MQRHISMLLLFAAVAPAYNPPVDTAGPITVRIYEPAVGLYGAGGPTALDRTEAPFTLEVALENTAAVAVSGTLRLGVIDRWRAKPAGPVAFTVAGHGHERMEFQVVIGEGTYSAHYPIHAWAEFTYQGKPMAAHAVMVVATQLPDPPRAVLPVEWKPVAAPETGAIGLWRLPVHRESARVNGAAFQAGRAAGEIFQAAAPVQSAARVRLGTEREAIAMALGPRPPSRQESVASAYTEYPLRLGKTRPIRLRFANAVSAGSATFRVRVLPFRAPAGQAGEVVFERLGAARAWEEGQVFLNRYAGQEIRLQLEAEASEPGSATQCYWAEPALEAGNPPAPAPAAFRSLGKAGGSEVRWQPGARGLLDATVSFGDGPRQLTFHGFRARVLGDALEDARSASELLETRQEDANGRARIRHRFRSWAGPFDLLGELWTERGVLRAHFWLENVPAPRPWLDVHLEEAGAGPWSRPAEQIYAGPGNVIRKPKAFRLSFDGHHLATSFVGFDFAGGVSLVEAVDAPPERLEVDPDARVYTLVTPHEQTLTFIPAENVWQGAKTWASINGVRAAGGVAKLAGRFVFDLWDFYGGYAASAAQLEKAFQYGLTDAAVVWHNWQRWGYDYRLPDLFPPNPEGGTLEDFVKLVRTCERHGVLFAPHDNYIDFYPDAEGFTYDDIVFLPNGRPMRAWYHWTRQAQSYRFRPDKLRPFLERNLRLIRDAISPTAYFIDVWSSMGPYDYWTSDGRFAGRAETRKVWGESFAWIREFLGGQAPQISEAGHDQLIGWLDGAQANILRVEAPPASGFLWSIAQEDAERTPWFDAVYHDRFVLHGAGYEDRYAGGLDLKEHGMYSDDYIATEVLTGHPAMVSEPFSRDVVRKYWLLHDLMRALALRRIESVEFAGGDLHRQHVRWDNGGEVFVNRGAGDWDVDGHVLPRYGFYARVPVEGGQVEAAVERRGAALAEWSRSPEMSYSDGFRVNRDSEGLLITPLPGSDSFELRLRWSSMSSTLPEPRVAEALDANRAVLRRVEVWKDNGEIRLRCEPGVFAYRLK